MSRKALYITLIAAIAAGGYYAGQWQANNSAMADMESSGAAATSSTTGDSSIRNLDRKVLYWQSPMNPTEIYESPGKSVMGMDLVPVYEGGASSTDISGTVSIDPTTVQNMGIRTTTVLQKDFSRVIRTFGEVEYDEEKLFLVNAKISGWIEKLYINFVGAEVTKGDPLLEIYSPELVSTQEEYLLAFRNNERISESAYPVAYADARLF